MAPAAASAFSVPFGAAAAAPAQPFGRQAAYGQPKLSFGSGKPVPGFGTQQPQVPAFGAPQPAVDGFRITSAMDSATGANGKAQMGNFHSVTAMPQNASSSFEEMRARHMTAAAAAPAATNVNPFAPPAAAAAPHNPFGPAAAAQPSSSLPPQPHRRPTRSR